MTTLTFEQADSRLQSMTRFSAAAGFFFASRLMAVVIAVRLFDADPQLGVKLGGVAESVVAVHGWHGHHGHLRIGLRVVKLSANAVNARNRFRRQHMGVVAYIICGFGQAVDLLCGHMQGERRGGKNQGNGQKQPENLRKCGANAFHRSQLYAGAHPKVPLRSCTTLGKQ